MPKPLLMKTFCELLKHLEIEEIVLSDANYSEMEIKKPLDLD